SRVDIAELKERDRNLQNEVERLGQQRRAIATSLEENRILIIQKQAEIETLAAECIQMEQQELELLRNRDERQSEITKLEQAKEALKEEISAKEEVVKDHRHNLDNARALRNEAEVEKTRIETQREDLFSRCQ